MTATCAVGTWNIHMRLLIAFLHKGVWVWSFSFILNWSEMLTDQKTVTWSEYLDVIKHTSLHLNIMWEKGTESSEDQWALVKKSLRVFFFPKMFLSSCLTKTSVTYYQSHIYHQCRTRFLNITFWVHIFIFSCIEFLFKTNMSRILVLQCIHINDS